MFGQWLFFFWGGGVPKSQVNKISDAVGFIPRLEDIMIHIPCYCYVKLPLFLCWYASLMDLLLCLKLDV